MLHVLFIILCLCFAIMLFCVFMIVRNISVCEERVNLIDSDFMSYKRLPSFDVMLWLS